MKELAAQEEAMLEARWRCRLLEKPKERRIPEWQTVCDREIEQLAAESHLAQQVRARSFAGPTPSSTAPIIS